MAGFYVTVSGLPDWFYTNQWFIDLIDSWTIEQLRTDISSTVPCTVASLKKDGVPLDPNAFAETELASGDTVVLVEG